jgi:hypothetical protein
MLIGVITLSFLRVMLSESGRTEKSTLADSAMNSAMAGVEDAKTILTSYNECVTGTSGKTNCDKIRKLVEESTDTCDLGEDSAGETTIGFSGEGNSGSINDQAYTCVNLTVKGDYVESIDDNNPVLVVPMRVEGGNVDAVEGVRLSWQSGNNESSSDYGNFKNGDVNKKDVSSVLGKRGVTADDPGHENVSKANGLKVTLIQTSADYDLDSFYVSDGASKTTNRATLMLLPSNDGSINENITKDKFIESADKTYNAPLSVRCDSTNLRCSAELHFPKPKPEGSTREESTFFLVISRVYSKPTIDEVRVKMFSDEAHENEIPFFNVQPIVDSTGRAGDLVRRVEVRLGSNAGQFVPLSELTVDGGLSKDFFVTKNCINGTSTCDK